MVANFFMGRELTRRVLGIPFLRDRQMEAETRRALEAGGTRIPRLRTSVEHLSGGQRQAIELNRFVHWGGKLVILDEPFAALGVEQTRRGLETIDRVRRRGIGIILITHVMAQAFAVADRIVVLRHGIVAGDLRTDATTPDEIVHLITGGIDRIGAGRRRGARRWCEARDAGAAGFERAAGLGLHRAVAEEGDAEDAAGELAAHEEVGDHVEVGAEREVLVDGLDAGGLGVALGGEAALGAVEDDAARSSRAPRRR